MSKRYKAKRRWRYYVRTQTCCRCGEKANECRINSWDIEPTEMLCGTHAREAGYCPGCGLFWAGVESYDFSGSGLCEHCTEEVRADSGEPDEPEYEGVFE